MAAWSGLWDYGQVTSGNYALLTNKTPIRNRMKGLINREQFRKWSALYNGLIGAATGSNVTATHKRIAQGDPTNQTMGGLRTIETITDINRNTAAADVTALKEMTYGRKNRPTYVKDLSGNGGPAFAG